MNILYIVRCAFAATLMLVLGMAVPAAMTFEDLLDESALEYVKPEGFTDIRPAANAVLPYERAVRHPAEVLEIRYAIRPLARAKVEYEDPHNATPDPNHLYAMMFRTLVDRLAAGGNSPLREYSPDQAQTHFNADWAAAAVFDVAEDFSQMFSQGLLVAMHKNHKADAYVVFLFNDYAQAKSIIKANLKNLRFR